MTGRHRHERKLQGLPHCDAPLVSIASWELDCCGPPLVVGELTTMGLLLVPADTRYDFEDQSFTKLVWDVQPWPDRMGNLRQLLRGGLIAAFIPGENGPDLADGRQSIPGELFGTRHGGDNSLEGFPTSTAEVLALWVIERHRIASDHWEMVLVPAAASPTEFHQSSECQQVGVLAELS